MSFADPIRVGERCVGLHILSRRVSLHRTRITPSQALNVAAVLLMLFSGAIEVLANESHAAAASTLDTNSPVEQFKTFLANPPRIAEIVFQRKVPVGGGMIPFDGTFAESTAFEYFQARWEPGAVFFRRLGDVTATTNATLAGQLVSSFEGTNWLVDTKPAFIRWYDRNPSATNKRFSVYYSRTSLLDPLRNVMNMGVMHVGVSSIRWHQNEFRIQSDVENDAWVVEGRVMSSASGRPEELRVTYHLGTEAYRYVLCYGFLQELSLAYLPTTITNFWVEKDGRRIDVGEWKLLDLKVSRDPLPSSAFNINPFLEASGWPIRVYTNRAYYSISTNGELRLFAALPSLTTNQDSRRLFGIRLLYTAWVAINLAFFALVKSVKNRQ